MAGGVVTVRLTPDAAGVLAALLRPVLRFQLDEVGVPPGERRDEVLRAFYALEAAGRASARGSEGAPPVAGGAPSPREFTTAQVAEVLGVTPRRARQVAAALAASGGARKAGRDWLVKASALVETEEAA